MMLKKGEAMSKTILITGASTGLGAATACLLAAGNEIFIHYCASREAAEKVAADVEAGGGKPHLVQADLSKEDGCRQLFKAVSSKADKLDLLVNNAGGMIKRQPAREYEWRLMEETFALNAFSAMMVTSLFIPMLEKGEDPNIINITSIGMRHGGPTATIYAATKGALDSFTRGLARELAPRIRVNAVAPGVIVTPFHDKVSTPQQMEAFSKACPLQVNGDPIHIAQTIKFIMDNNFLTGETIDVNGGLFMR